MHKLIGKTAGRVWETLRTHGPLPISQLPKKVKERDMVVYQALGWLAREDKIVYETKGKTTLVSLVK